MTELRQLLTVKQAASMLAVSTSTLRELVRVGEIAFIQKGRGTERQHMSFHPLDIEDYIKRSRVRKVRWFVRRRLACVDRPHTKNTTSWASEMQELPPAGRQGY